jgi:hypothetical protein
MKNLFPTVLLALLFSVSLHAYDGEIYEPEGEFEQPFYEETEFYDEPPMAKPLPGIHAKEFDEYEAHESYDAFEPYEPPTEPYDDYGYGGDDMDGDYYYY